MKCGARALLVGAACATTVAAGARVARSETRVEVIDEGVRVGSASLANGPERTRLAVDAFRGEVAAFQIVVGSDSDSLDDVTLSLPPFRDAKSQLPGADVLIEHFVDVKARSRNETAQRESLGWRERARPLDDGMLGIVPDALVPLDLASCKSDARDFCPYPLHLAPGTKGAFFVDVLADAPGTFSSHGVLHSGDRIIGAVDVTIRVAPVELPFGAVSVFAFYSYDTLVTSFDAPGNVEKNLWQILHAHGVDAAPNLASAERASSLASAYRGQWFTADEGYVGPGVGALPEVALIGAYGSLGAPTPDKVAIANDIARALPETVPTRFVYTIDEQCESPLGRDWQRALTGSGIRTGRTCGEDPSSQESDVVLMPAQAFSIDGARRARDAGKEVDVYNGQLPFAGPMMLDAPPTSLTANGWIASSYAAGRWFYWETTFWNDDNRGGRGPRDPFADPETFHNADGDSALGDGLLLYPARQRRFPAHSLDRDVVLPSLRLKALRRGIEDAGLLALAHRADREATLAIAKEAVPAAFDDTDPDGPPTFELDPVRLAALRARLREVALHGHAASTVTMTRSEARAELDLLREERAAKRRPRVMSRTAESLFLPLAGLALLLLGAASSALLAKKPPKR